MIFKQLLNADSTLNFPQLNNDTLELLYCRIELCLHNWIIILLFILVNLLWNNLYSIKCYIN